MPDWEALRDRRNARLLMLIVAAPLLALALALGPLALARGRLEAEIRSHHLELGALSRAQLEHARSSPAVQAELDRFFARLSGPTRPVPSRETLAVARAFAALGERAGVPNLEVSPGDAPGDPAEPGLVRLESLDGQQQLALSPRRVTLRATADFFALLELLDELDARGQPYRVEAVRLHKRGARVEAQIDVVYFGLAVRDPTDAGPEPQASGGAES